MVGSVITRSNAEVSGGLEVREECKAHKHRYGLRARESLTRVVLVADAQALHE